MNTFQRLIIVIIVLAVLYVVVRGLTTAVPVPGE